MGRSSGLGYRIVLESGGVMGALEYWIAVICCGGYACHIDSAVVINLHRSLG